ncbi:potassium channel protein [Archaeoglobales archaeon]|nr:MAG: potassium channel protein [Archaeoglobales archaeon ex4484_92]RLI81906.1 MAG: potassium channel protein [Archaeoglobales archaeon]HDN74437.1 potassium channel protein [Archaeoglobus sp.]
MANIRQKVARVVALLAAVIVFGTVSYHLIEGWPLFDSLYMTTITITTTGYGEIRKMTIYGRILSMLLMFVGVAIFLYSINVLIGVVVEGSLRRWERMLGKMTNHYIVCGYGLMGKEVVKELPKEKIVVIDSDINKINLAREDNLIAVHGDATDESILEKAGIRRAKAIVCCMSDASNAFAVLIAKDLNPSIQTIVVLRSPDVEKKMQRLGVDVLLSPYRDTAKKVFATLVKRASIEFIETVISGEESLNLEKVVVDERLANRTLMELDLRRKTGCIVVAVVRKGEVILPEAETRLVRGDILYMMCREATKLEQFLSS